MATRSTTAPLKKGPKRKRRTRKPRWLTQLKKTGIAPKSQNDGKKNPTAIPGKTVEFYPSRAEGQVEPSPHYHLYLEEDTETFWCETIGLPISSKAKTSIPMSARKTDKARCKNRKANPKLFPMCADCEKFPTPKQVDQTKVCIKCSEAKPHPQFKGAYEIAGEFIGWCNTCVGVHVDSIGFLAEYRRITGKSGAGVLAEFEKFPVPKHTTKELAKIGEEYFTLTKSGRLIAYNKEQINGKERVGSVCVRGRATRVDGIKQEAAVRPKNKEGISLHPTKPKTKNVRHARGGRLVRKKFTKLSK